MKHMKGVADCLAKLSRLTSPTRCQSPFSVFHDATSSETLQSSYNVTFLAVAQVYVKHHIQRPLCKPLCRTNSCVPPFVFFMYKFTKLCNSCRCLLSSLFVPQRIVVDSSNTPNRCTNNIMCWEDQNVSLNQLCYFRGLLRFSKRIVTALSCWKSKYSHRPTRTLCKKNGIKREEYKDNGKSGVCVQFSCAECLFSSDVPTILFREFIR